MADPLREKLQALFGELYQQAALYRRGQELSNESQALAYTQCARKIAALLAESEPKPVLKLGHEFMAAIDSLGRASKSSADFCGECGQPREAH